jgi:DNA-binding CsgD family transcriptional regulator
MTALDLDDGLAGRRSVSLGSLVESIGAEDFLPTLMRFCHDATGASDCSIIVHRGEEPELAATVSVAGTRARDVGDWYMRGGFYRVEPSMRLAREAQGRLLMHTLERDELPDPRWSERYERVGLYERLSLLVRLEEGWAFMNAYRPESCGVTMDSASFALGEHAHVVGAAVRRHVAQQRARSNSPVAFDDLSDRERQVVDAILEGLSAKEAAKRLGLSPTSIATYRQRAFEKLGISRQVQLFQLVRN